MKRLLLALSISGTAILAAGQAPPASADCLHRTYYYYEYNGGPLCGYQYTYCDGIYRQGCQTEHFTFVGGCECP